MKSLGISFISFISTCLFSNLVLANPTSYSAPSLTPKASITSPLPPKLNINAKSWVLMVYKTGQILSEHNPNERLAPASLTKLMTSYVVSHAVESGTISLKDMVHVSKNAWKTGGSKMFIKAGEKISVENLMKGMIIQSGNDSTVALAEYMAGSQGAFAAMMNQTAKQLGMHNSHFDNASGLPSKDQYSSAYDLAILSRALISHFPAEYKWYSQKEFTWDNITQRNRNRLLWYNKDVDGLKTGYTKAAKYCLVVSAEKTHMRLIAVIMGAKSPSARAAEAQKLLTYGFRFYKTHELYQTGKVIEKIKVTDGVQTKVGVAVHKNIWLSIPRGHYKALTAKLSLPKILKAPVKANSKVGTLVVTLHGKILANAPLYTTESVQKASFWQKVKRIF